MLLQDVLSRMQQQLFNRMEASSTSEEREHLEYLTDYLYRDLGGLLSGLGYLDQVVPQLNGEQKHASSSKKVLDAMKQ